MRAVEEPLDVRLRRADVYPVLEVRNPLHGTAYEVLLPEYPATGAALCTCTDFARRGLGTCKHIEAALRWVADHPVTDIPRGGGRPTPVGNRVWKEIDRRLRELPRASGPASLRLRRPGAALYERAGVFG